MQDFTLPTDMHERGDYRVFSHDLEDNPLVCFHGTKLANFESIVEHGLRQGIHADASLQSISYAGSSTSALTHWIGRRQEGEDGVILAFEFEDLDGLTIEGQFIYDYKTAPSRPKIIGYCTVPASYVHR